MVKKRVLAAMSGGVDSSVAAALLLEQGYEVIGATMQLFADKTLSRETIASARNVAQKLDIEHYAFDMSRQFKDKVIDEFVNEYASGCTPNPCVICNEYLKFGALLDEAEKLGCQYIATGHYARVQQKEAATYIQKANNLKKDQSYFLYRLQQDVLRKIIFPLGNVDSKAQVREMAKKFNLPVVDKQDSQDVCFIPDNDTKAFLSKHNPKLKRKGNIVLADTQEILGQHEGIAFYTIGQRKGLGIAYKEPLYIVDINARTNTVILSTNENIFAYTAWAKDLAFAYKMPQAGEELLLKAKIRYAHKEETANVRIINNALAKITFTNKQRAITPGQSVVFYDNELVLGGGIICKAADNCS